MAKVTLLKREPTHAQIANRAFEIYVSRGGMVTILKTGLKPNGGCGPNFGLRSPRSSDLGERSGHFPFARRGSTVSERH